MIKRIIVVLAVVAVGCMPKIKQGSKNTALDPCAYNVFNQSGDEPKIKREDVFGTINKAKTWTLQNHQFGKFCNKGRVFVKEGFLYSTFVGEKINIAEETREVENKVLQLLFPEGLIDGRTHIRFSAMREKISPFQNDTLLVYYTDVNGLITNSYQAPISNWGTVKSPYMDDISAPIPNVFLAHSTAEGFNQSEIFDPIHCVNCTKGALVETESVVSPSIEFNIIDGQLQIRAIYLTGTKIYSDKVNENNDKYIVTVTSKVYNINLMFTEKQ